MIEPSVPLRVGWFGKMPSAGDFVSRNVEPSVQRRLDEWLQASIAASRERLGEDWLDAFLHAPVWRFALHGSPDPGRTTIGIMIPSVDRVGRYFPFAILAEIEGVLGTRHDLVRADTLLTEVEPHLLGVLADEFDADTFDYEIRKLTDELRRRKQARSGAHWTDAPATDGEAASRTSPDAEAPATWWWTEGADMRRHPSFERFEEMPPAHAFTRFIRDENPDADLELIWRECADGPLSTNPPVETAARIGALHVVGMTGLRAGGQGSAAHLDTDRFDAAGKPVRLAATGADGLGEWPGRGARFLCRVLVAGGAEAYPRARDFLTTNAKGASPRMALVEGDRIVTRGECAIGWMREGAFGAVGDRDAGNAVPSDRTKSGRGQDEPDHEDEPGRDAEPGAVASGGATAHPTRVLVPMPGERLVVAGPSLRHLLPTLGNQLLLDNPVDAARGAWEEALIAGIPSVEFLLVIDCEKAG